MNENENLAGKTESTKTALTPSKQKICKFFNSEKGCDKGSKCKFLHQNNKDNLDNDNLNNVKNSNENSKEDTKITEKKYCKFFNTNAGCRNGDNCQFIHEINPNANENDTNSTPSKNRKRRNRKRNNNKNGKEQDDNSENEDEEDESVIEENDIKEIKNGKRNNNNNNKNNHRQNQNNNHNRNSHNRNENKNKSNKNNKNNKNKNKNKEEDTTNENTNKDTKEETDNVNTITEVKISIPKKVNSDRVAMSRPKPIYAEKKSPREIEMYQLKRRYIDSYQVVTEIEAFTKVTFEFSPTDPDFPFELDFLLIELMIPMTYPIGACKITKITNKDVPQHLLTNIMNMFNRKANITPRLPLVNLMNWLDHNLEYLLINREVAPTVSISFVSNTKPSHEPEKEAPNSTTTPALSNSSTPIPPTINEKSDGGSEAGKDEEDDEDDEEANDDGDNDNDDDDGDDDDENEDYSSNYSDEEEESDDDDYDDDDQKLLYAENTTGMNSEFNEKIQKADEKGVVNPSATTGAPRGIQIRVPNIKIVEISLLHCVELNFTVRCNRCKSTIDFQGIKPMPGEGQPREKNNSAYWKCCLTCKQNIGIRFRSELLHEQSLSLGYLDLEGCDPLDFLPSDFILQCARCITDQQVIKKIKRSQDHDIFCRKCHCHMILNIDQIKYMRIGVSDKLEGGDALPVPQLKLKKSRQKDVKQELGIVQGEPLPNKGVCKHYKKSHRWLRFPCCNKIYPCDICHEENSDGHEMKWANRMICGYCSKEQPFSDKPCCKCGKYLTRKNSVKGFWEGGEGNRDQTKMNKYDKRKYRGKAKTTSNRSIKKSEGGKSKS